MGVFGAIGNAIKKPMQAAGKVVGKVPGMGSMGRAVGAAPGMGMMGRGLGLGPSAPPMPPRQPQPMASGMGQLPQVGPPSPPMPMNNGVPPVQGGMPPASGGQDNTSLTALRGPSQMGQGPQQGIGPSFGGAPDYSGGRQAPPGWNEQLARQQQRNAAGNVGASPSIMSRPPAGSY